MNKALFVGGYPNPVNKYHRVFFRSFIEQVADKGVECYVISPVSVTKMLVNVLKIPKISIEKTPNDNSIRVYRPRIFTLSNYKLATINMRVVAEHNFQLAALKVAAHLCKENDFDFVYGHFFLSGGLAAVKIGKEYNIPSYIAFGESSLQTQVIEPYGAIQPFDVEGLNGIISVSNKNTKELETLEVFNDIPILTAPNAVDLGLFQEMNKEECRKRLNLPLDKFIVGFVGGFCNRKGDKRVLEAVNQLDDVFVAFAGKGDDLPSGDKVLFCSALDHSLIPVFLNAIDVFCLPTLNEGSCNAIVEAGACGVPVISSDLPFNYDILTKDNSILINPDSIDSISSAIYELYKNSSKRLDLSRRIKDSATKFDIRNRIDNILNFIDQTRTV